MSDCDLKEEDLEQLKWPAVRDGYNQLCYRDYSNKRARKIVVRERIRDRKSFLKLQR